MAPLAPAPPLIVAHRRLQELSRPVTFGALATLALVGLYLGLISLAQGWTHASEQIGGDAGFVVTIALGFGVQVGLFTYMRGLRMHGNSAGVATSTGTSSVAMLACCAHHVTDILPILGLSGAAIFLNAYRTPLLWLGVVMNLGGIAYLLYRLERHRKMLNQMRMG